MFHNKLVFTVRCY